MSAMNGNVKTFQATSVECQVGSIDGKVERNVSKYTTQKVTGKMSPIEWRVHGKNWPHLKACVGYFLKVDYTSDLIT